jgi:hypothetical protein
MLDALLMGHIEVLRAFGQHANVKDSGLLSGIDRVASTIESRLRDEITPSAREVEMLLVDLAKTETPYDMKVISEKVRNLEKIVVMQLSY